MIESEDIVYGAACIFVIGLAVYGTIAAPDAIRHRKEADRKYVKSLVDAGCKVIDHIPSSSVSSSGMGMSMSGNLVVTDNTVTIPDKYKYQCHDGKTFWLERDIYKGARS